MNQTEMDVATALRVTSMPYNAAGEENIFSITFVKADGSIRTIEKAKRRQLSPEAPLKGKLAYNLKNTHTVLIYEVGNPKPRTIKIPTILFINQWKIRH